jgi:hypothetical protein
MALITLAWLVRGLFAQSSAAAIAGVILDPAGQPPPASR